MFWLLVIYRVSIKSFPDYKYLLQYIVHIVQYSAINFVVFWLLVIYRVSIKSFPDYKYLLQENYVEYKHFFFQNVTQEDFLQHITTLRVLRLLHRERLIDNQWFCFVIPQNTLGFLLHWRHSDTSRLCNITINTT